MNEPHITFDDLTIKNDPILKYFQYRHLPDHLQEISYLFAKQAQAILLRVPPSAERTAGLRKLLEAKDCIVRAAVRD